MRYSLKTINILNIEDQSTGHTTYGGNQAWYPNFWRKQSGCGPTTAANQMAYLSQTREQYRSLYQQPTLLKKDYTKHMQQLFKHVTPSMMGVNHINKLKDGVIDYASKTGVSLDAFTLSVEKDNLGHRSMDDLIDFIQKGLSNDSPIAFLNLNSGKERRLYPWHWITITEATINNHTIIATASDEGRKKTFDLSLWYQTTPMHGGFVYFI